MMKGSSSLRAFSMGILIATAALWGGYIYDGKEAPPSEPSLTKESIQEYLKEKDSIMISKQEYTELINKVKKMNLQQAAQPPSPKTATIQIQQGTRAVDVANLLEQQGIIQSASEFQQYLADARLTNKLRVGTYQITPNMSFTEIANILTKQVIQE